MGCHTWFYKKINPQPSKEEVRNTVIKYFKEQIDFWKRVISGEVDKELLESYPELTPEQANIEIPFIERKIRVISNGYCELAMYHRYVDAKSKYPILITYIKGKGFYKETPYHDLFRRGGYPIHKLFSLEETLDYIRNPNNHCETYDYTEEKLKEFWEEYPDAVIKFG